MAPFSRSVRVSVSSELHSQDHCELEKAAGSVRGVPGPPPTPPTPSPWPYSSPRSSSRQGVAGLTTPTTPTPAARTLVVVLTLLRCMLTLLRCVLTYSGGGTHHSNARRPHVGGYDARQSLVGALRGRRHPLRALQRRPFSVLLRAGALPIENSSPRKQT
jgi:hypothetical protein